MIRNPSHGPQPDLTGLTGNMIRNPSHEPEPDLIGLTGNMIRNPSHGHALSYATQNTQHTQHTPDFRRHTSVFSL
jgi:hypothetical protein